MKQTKQTIDTKICEACGEDFTCGANTEKCWCFEVDLSGEILEDLRENFKSCLCENCLNEKSKARLESKL